MSLNCLLAMMDRQLVKEGILQQRQLTVQCSGNQGHLGVPTKQQLKLQLKQSGGFSPLHPPPVPLHPMGGQGGSQIPQQYEAAHNGGGDNGDGSSGMQFGADGDEAADLWGVGSSAGGKHSWTSPPDSSMPWDNYDEKTGVPLLVDTPTELPAFSAFGSGGSSSLSRLPFDTPQWRASHPRPDHVVAVHRLAVRSSSSGTGSGIGIVQWTAHKIASRANRMAMASSGSDTKQQCFNALAMDYTRAMWNVIGPVYKLQRIPAQNIKLKFEETSFVGFELANDAMWDTSIDQLYQRVLKTFSNFYTNFTDTIFRTSVVGTDSISGIREVKAGDFATVVTDPVNLRLGDHSEADDADEAQLINIGSQHRQQQLLLEFSSPASHPSTPSSPSSSSPSSPSSSLQQLSSLPPPTMTSTSSSSASASSLSYPTPVYVPPSSPWSAVTISSPMSPQSPLSPSSSPHHDF